MAGPGMPISYVASVPGDPMTVTRNLGASLFAGGGYFDSIEIMPIGPTSFLVTRRFVPGWAVAVAILGALFFLLGLLALLVRTTEQVRIDVVGEGRSSSVRVAGVARPDLYGLLAAMPSRLGGQDVAFAAAGPVWPQSPVPGLATPRPAPPGLGPGPTPPGVAPALPAGQWGPDPTGRHQVRWWDGQQWSANVADDGVVGVDPLGG